MGAFTCGQQPGYAADMVFVAVRDADAAYAALFAFEVCDIGQYQVYAEHFFFGKAHAHINDNNVFAVFNYGHVLADLAQPADRYEPYIFGCGLRVYILCLLLLCQYGLLFAKRRAQHALAPYDLQGALRLEVVLWGPGLKQR